MTEVYEEMPNEFFKHLRRVATIHKTKMNWNINAYQMNRNIIGEAGHK